MVNIQNGTIEDFFDSAFQTAKVSIKFKSRFRTFI